MNRLYFGDNLKWLRDAREFPDASVDLVYLDPPFNSNADYNVLFREASGELSQAQFHAFTDTWSWADAAETYHQFIDNCPNVAVVEMMEAFHSFLKNSPMMAYLAMMAPRLVASDVHREKIIVQVKGGGTGAKDIRDLIGTVENQKAIGGVLITLDKPTKPMRDDPRPLVALNRSSGKRISRKFRSLPSKACSTAPSASTPRARSIPSPWPPASPPRISRRRCCR
jgi:hypothetical protein